jgi:hypothetical protein
MTGRRRKPGRMGSSIEEYRAWLVGWSYAPETVKNMLATAGDLGRWMDIRDVAPDRVDRCVIAEFRVACSAAGCDACRAREVWIRCWTI